jgi:hypothetical protein
VAVMLVAAAAFVIVADPPVAVANLLASACSRTGKPKHCTNKDAQHGSMRKDLWEIELRQLVQNGVTNATHHDYQPQPHENITE